MEACEPKIETNGRLYQDSVMGALLSLSVLPRNATAMHEFFDNPMDQVRETIDLIAMIIIYYYSVLNIIPIKNNQFPKPFL